MAEKEGAKNSGWIKIAGLVVFVAAIVLVFRLTPLSLSDFTPDKMRQFINSFGVMAPIVFIIIYSLRAVILVLPVGVMSLAGGLAFGKWLGTLYILIGATAGSCLSFLMARYLGRSFIEKLGVMKKGKLKQFEQGIENNGFRVILFVRLIPLFQYDAVNFGLGLSKMKFRDYAIGSFIGMAPGGFINAMLGSSLDNIISVQFFAALGFFILLMFIPAIYNGIKKKREKKAEAEPKGTKEATRGKCPGCGASIGPIAILIGWDKWGRFVCPPCGAHNGFKGWFAAVVILFGCFFGIERLVRFLIMRFVPDFPIHQGPLWLILILAFVLSMMVMVIIPRFWKFKET